MFERTRRNHPRLNRWDRRLGAVLVAVIAAGAVTRIVVMNWLGLSVAPAAAIYALLIALFIWAELAITHD